MALTEIKTSGIADDAITTDKLANAINTERAANTAKVSTTINNNADNRVITGSGTANTLEGEANLTFTSDVLQVSSTTQGLGAKFINTGNEYTNLQFSAARTGAGQALGIMNAKWNNNHEVAAIYLTAGDDTSNKDDGQIKFYTAAASGSVAERLHIKNNGDVSVTDGNLVVGTSGHGIDFSATSHNAGMTSELLDTYEEGTWTPTINNGYSVTYSYQGGEYTRIGQLVYFNFYIQISSMSGSNTQGSYGVINGLPFTSTANNLLGWGSTSIPWQYSLGQNITHAYVDQNSTTVQLLLLPSGGDRTHSSPGTLWNGGDSRIAGGGVYQTG